ncbi:MAG: hypothetical protein IPK99_12360 [Flavobacteriales bacterium]|nr:hypothetical protein [Flavobacteriales bacterium]
MAGIPPRRIAAIAGAALRHAVVPLGSLAVSWWVVRNGSLALWGSVVVPLVTLQLAVHLAQWGQRDLLVRMLRAGDADPRALWRDNLFTRWPLALPLLALPTLFSPAAAPWLLVWALCAMLGGSLDPLIIRDKRFLPAFFADVAGLLAQFVALVAAEDLDAAVIIRSFAVHHAVRAMLLWWVCGRPLPWPAHFDPHTHLRQAIPFVLIGLGGLLATRIDVYAVTTWLPAEALGRYQVIASVFMQFQLVPGLWARPFSTGMLRLDRSTLKRSAQRALQWALLGTPLQAVLVWFLLGSIFDISPGWGVLVAGCLAVLPAYGYVPLYPILYRAHREREVALLSFAAAGTIAIGALLLVPRWGVAGGLAASALGQWTQLLGVSFLVQRLPEQQHG